MKPPLLVLAWGNRSRGDDALGPLLADALRAACDPARVEVIEDYQLQPEHALDLLGRERVLFVDASRALRRPCSLTRVRPRADPSYTTHAMSPAALLQACVDALGEAPPRCWQLAVRGEGFALGSGLTPGAGRALASAHRRAAEWIRAGAPLPPSAPADKAAPAAR